MRDDNIRLNVLRYTDVDDHQRETLDDWYVGERGRLHAMARTPEGVTRMLDRMESQRA